MLRYDDRDIEKRLEEIAKEIDLSVRSVGDQAEATLSAFENPRLLNAAANSGGKALPTWCARMFHSPMKCEVVGEALQSGGLPDRDQPVLSVVEEWAVARPADSRSNGFGWLVRIKPPISPSKAHSWLKLLR